MQILSPAQQDETKLLALGEIFAAHGGYRAAADAVRSKTGVVGFMERVARHREREPIARAADEILGFASDDADPAGYSITRALKASYEAANGNSRAWEKAGLERDVSNLATTAADTVPNGFFVPLGLMARDFNVGTSTEAGNLLGAAVSADRSADPLRKVSLVAALGGTVLTGLRATLSLPRFASATTPGWKSEVAAAQQLAETTAAAVLTPRRVAVQMVLSRQALLQGTPALDQTITRHLLAAIWQQIDDGALNGDGTSDSPVGVRNTSGVGSVIGGTDGAQLSFAHLADLEAAPALANAPETDLSGFAVNQATRRWLRTAARDTGLPFIWDGGGRPLLGHRAAVSLTLPSNLVKGASGAVCSSLLFSTDWSQLVVGIYGGGIDVLLDKITAADSGKVKITASALVGVGVNQPASFAKMDDAKTA